MDKKGKNTPNFKYEFDKKLGIIFKYYYGIITIEDIVSSWEFAIINNLIPKENKGFILDYRKASFKISIDEYLEIPKFYKLHPELFLNHKIAILTERPEDIVIPILVKIEDVGYESEPFSTLEAAINWIL